MPTDPSWFPHHPPLERKCRWCRKPSGSRRLCPEHLERTREYGRKHRFNLKHPKSAPRYTSKLLRKLLADRQRLESYGRLKTSVLLKRRERPESLRPVVPYWLPPTWKSTATYACSPRWDVEAFQSLVRRGVCTSGGVLTEAYGGQEAE